MTGTPFRAGYNGGVLACYSPYAKTGPAQHSPIIGRKPDKSMRRLARWCNLEPHFLSTPPAPAPNTAPQRFIIFGKKIISKNRRYTKLFHCH